MKGILFFDFICVSILLFYLAYTTLGDIIDDIKNYKIKRKEEILRAIQKSAIAEADRVGVPVSDGKGTAWFPGGTTLTASNAPYLAVWTPSLRQAE